MATTTAARRLAPILAADVVGCSRGIVTELALIEKSGLQQTPRWREMDSNL
jgi:hypothetical protein